MSDHTKDLPRWLLDYAKAHPKFTAEQAWAVIEQIVGAPVPTLSKGSLFRRTLIEPGHVVQHSTEKAKNKQAKGRMVVVWKSTLCTEEEEFIPLQTWLAQIQSSVNLHEITLMEGLKKAYEIGAGAGSL
jgi:hypothetical protein